MISNLTIDAGNFRMKLTVTIDDKLVEEAKYTSRIPTLSVSLAVL